MGPESVPKDLVRVRIAKDLEECEICLRELQFVGLDPWPGSDSLDPFDTPGAIGIYVRREDLEAARFLVGGKRPLDPLTRPQKKKETGRDPNLIQGEAYLELGKYKEVIRRLSPLDQDAEAQKLVSDAYLRSGRLKEAIGHAHHALSLLAGQSWAESLFLVQLGVSFALGYDGTPFGRGSNLVECCARLEAASVKAPRDLRIGQMLLEVYENQGRKRAARSEFERLKNVNPNLLAVDGWYRDLYESLRLLA
jgi:tetratricopeptide (TPR) repeat protein